MRMRIILTLMKGFHMRRYLPLLALFSLVLATPVRADDNKDYVLVLKDHQFSPKDLVLPANQKLKLIVKNEQATTAEFESADLDREKVVEANSEITVFLGPLDAGTYTYFDDFHHATTGTLTVK